MPVKVIIPLFIAMVLMFALGLPRLLMTFPQAKDSEAKKLLSEAVKAMNSQHLMLSPASTAAGQLSRSHLHFGTTATTGNPDTSDDHLIVVFRNRGANALAIRSRSGHYFEALPVGASYTIVSAING